eukprot:scaffold231200_cov22-Tisochrysis_lutea.AAC.3
MLVQHGTRPLRDRGQHGAQPMLVQHGAAQLCNAVPSQCLCNMVPGQARMFELHRVHPVAI